MALIKLLLFASCLALTGAAILQPPSYQAVRRSTKETAASRTGSCGRRHASPSPSDVTIRGSACGQASTTNRGCWKNTWDVTTDYDITIPEGAIKTYDLTITNITSFSPDGVEKSAMLINGIYPGPTIVADWGDTLQISIHNQLADNGTVFHWHGFRQLNSGTQDGVNGVTECPIPPGASRTYIFRATQYGTSWYHSHYSTQYGNGLVGAIQINGPASANYDIDLGPYAITDWYHVSIDMVQLKAELATGAPPPSDNILFNGTNINPNGGGGQYSRVTLTPGKKHLLRLINTSVDAHFTISLTGHNFTVIAIDFVPIEPVVKNQLFLAIGQRYDVIIEASQEVNNYWFNATLATSGLCGVSLNKSPAAVFSYEGAGSGIPTYAGPRTDADCHDSTGFVPIVKRDLSPSDFATHLQELDVNLTTTVINRGKVFRWTVNGHTSDVQWDKPILQYVQEDNSSFPIAANIINLDEPDVWTYWVIENDAPPLPHPIHLHGHDFLVLGSGDGGRFNPSTDTARLNFANPIRRDVAMLPAGWLVIAFKTDNPGAWLLHCHIAWHVSQGLSVQFIEVKNRIPEVMDLQAIQPNCNAWRSYQERAAYPKIDSGL